MKTYLKFGSLIVAILVTLGLIAKSSISETSTYYKSISELQQMTKGKDHRLRVGGDVSDSIVRHGKEIQFTLTQDKLTLAVVYAGNEPLPDTFKPGAQALVDGKLGPDGLFHATKIQAKCASKYEAKPIQMQSPQATAGPRAAL
jgi:cytochrome c-type biogenesis protein CcmE